MQDIQEMEAALLELLQEMEGDAGDAHEIYLKLRQDGLQVNHKRVDRLYALGQMHVRRRRPGEGGRR